MRKWAFIILVFWLATVAMLIAPARSAAPANSAGDPTELQASQASQVPAATATAEPFIFPSGTIIAGQDVGGLQAGDAERRVTAAITPFLQPLRVIVGGQSYILDPLQAGIDLQADAIVQQAQAVVQGSQALQTQHFPLEIAVDRNALYRFLESIAEEIERPALLAVDPQSLTFVITPGLRLDIDASLERLVSRLQSPDSNRRVNLQTIEVREVEPPTSEQILEFLEPTIEEWPGVVGIYAADMQGNPIFSYNADTVFSGASTMKIAILLQAYLSLPSFSKQQLAWAEAMIVESDNKSSNNLLSAIGRAEYGRSNGLLGLQAMNLTLQKIGLKRTYMLAPYESVGGVIDPDTLNIPRNRGEPPYTDPDPYLQTTPLEMAQLMLLIGQCEQGFGELLELYSQLSAERCAEMLELLELAGDRDKLRAGIPEDVRVAHKSGWISDMRADVGVIGSGEDAMVLSVWIWSDEYGDWIPESIADPLIAGLARTLYSAYHPFAVEELRVLMSTERDE